MPDRDAVTKINQANDERATIDAIKAHRDAYDATSVMKIDAEIVLGRASSRSFASKIQIPAAKGGNAGARLFPTSTCYVKRQVYEAADMIRIKARDGRKVARDNSKRRDSVDVQLPLKVCERIHAGRGTAEKIRG